MDMHAGEPYTRQSPLASAPSIGMSVVGPKSGISEPGPLESIPDLRGSERRQIRRMDAGQSLATSPLPPTYSRALAV